jgi:hypothetical protein
MRILLDTNVLLRSLEPMHAHHSAVADAIDRLREKGHELVIAPQVLYEFWSVATRRIEHNGLGMTPAAITAIDSDQRCPNAVAPCRRSMLGPRTFNRHGGFFGDPALARLGARSPGDRSAV